MKSWFKKEQKPEAVVVPATGFFTTDHNIRITEKKARDARAAVGRSFQKNLKSVTVTQDPAGLDSADCALATASDSLETMTGALRNSASMATGVPALQMEWYGGQGFIGYQFCAMLAQNWLINKACTMPARDAVRMGWELSVADAQKLTNKDDAAKILDELRAMDKKFNIKKNLIQFSKFGRIFGIRVAMFVVDSDDPEYYTKPFNPDGIKPGSYRGITQIDPYWIMPELSVESSGNPSSIHFYEPTWWRISGVRVHRSHLIITRGDEVADILKPSYVFGGLSIPQKVYERVYAAERTANEAPMLAMTKRMTVIKADMAQALADQTAFEQRIQQWVALRDNYGIKAVGLDEEVQVNDTSLADLDAVIMTQYQLVAAASEVPATKLLGTQPKGFNTTGDYEEASYHEMLESIQENDLTPLLERHYLCLMRSYVMPKLQFSQPVQIDIAWSPLDSPTAKEIAEINLIKAQAGQALAASGAIDGMDERQRIIDDPDSGYNNLAPIVDEQNPELAENGILEGEDLDGEQA